MIALLIDPDKSEESLLNSIIDKANDLDIDLIFIGGSLMTGGNISETTAYIKSKTSIPTILFPGSPSQITNQADGILFLSLLSSRNADMLIGQQVTAAPYLMKTDLEIISTAYLLIDSGKQTTASYMSNSNPIPADKPEIAASTALAGEYLGMQLIYLDGGSGAQNPIPQEMIAKVSEFISAPLVIGGGLNSIEKIKAAFTGGADIAVIGNAVESDPDFLNELKGLKSELND